MPDNQAEIVKALRAQVEASGNPAALKILEKIEAKLAPKDDWNPDSDRPLAPAQEPGLLSELGRNTRDVLERQYQNTMAFANPQPAYDPRTDPSLLNIAARQDWDKGFISYNKKGDASLAPAPAALRTYLVRRFMDLAQGLGMATAPVIGTAQTVLEGASGALTGGTPRLVPLGEEVEPGTGLVPRLGNYAAQGLGAASGFTLPEPIAHTARALGADQETSDAIGLAGSLIFAHGASKAGGKLASKVKLPDKVSNKLYGVKTVKPAVITPIEIPKFNELREAGKAPSSLTETSAEAPAGTISSGFDKADQPTTKVGKKVKGQKQKTKAFPGFENSEGGSLYKFEKQADGSYAFKPQAEVTASINSSTPKPTQPITKIELAGPKDFQVSEPGATEQIGQRRPGGKVKPTAEFTTSTVGEATTSPADAAVRIRKPKPPLTSSGSARVDSDLPHELKAVRDGQAPAWFLPNLEEGTIPTKGEAWFRKQTGDKIAEALGPDVRVLQTNEGTVIFNPAIVTTEQIRALEAEGRTTDLVNGNRTSPKPENPTTAVVATGPDGVEVRTVLTDSAEKTAEAVAHQKAQGLTVEVIPVNGPEAARVLRNRTTVPLKPNPRILTRSRYADSLGAEEGTKGIFNPAEHKRRTERWARLRREDAERAAKGEAARLKFRERSERLKSLPMDTPIQELFPDKAEFVRNVGRGLLDHVASHTWDGNMTLRAFRDYGRDKANAWGSDSPPDARSGVVRGDILNLWELRKAREKPVEGPKTSEPTLTTSDTGSSPVGAPAGSSGAIAGRVLKALQEKDSFYAEPDTLATMAEKARKEGKSISEVILETAREEKLDHPEVKLLEETIKAEADQYRNAPVSDSAPANDRLPGDDYLERGEEGALADEDQAHDNRQTNQGFTRGGKGKLGIVDDSPEAKKTRGTSGGRKTKEVEAQAEARRQTVLNTIAAEYANTPEVVKVLEDLRSKSKGAKVVGRKLQPLILQQSWAKLKEAMPDLTMEDVAHALTGVRRATQMAEKITGEKPAAKFRTKSKRGQKGTISFGGGQMGPMLGKAGKAIFEDTLHALSKVNEQGRNLALKMKQTIHEANVDYHMNVNPLMDAWSALSAADKAALSGAARQGRQDYTGLSPEARAYGALWHDTVNKLETERYKVGNFIQGRGGPRRSYIPAKDFQPLHFDPAYVEKMKAGDPASLAEFQKLNPGVKTNPFVPTHNPKTGAVIDIASRVMEAHELSRQFKYPESAFTKNLHESHKLWVEEVTKSNAEHRNYRYNNPDGTPRNGGIGDKSDFYHSLTKNEREGWERTIDTVEGHGWRNLTENQQKLDTVVRAVNLYTTVAKIGLNIGSGIKQVTSLGNVATTAGYTPLVRGLVDHVLNPVSSWQKARAKGAAPFAHEFPEYYGSGAGERAGHVAKTAVRLSTAFTGFMDGVTRTIAHEAAPHALQRFQEHLQAGGEKGAHVTHVLEDMLLKPEEIKEIGSGKVSVATELKFKNSFVEYTQQSARMANRPRWTHEGAGKLVSHLKQFSIAQTRFDLQNVVKEAREHGNYGPLRRRVISAIVMGEVVNAALSPFRDEDKDRKDWADMKNGEEVLYRLAQDMANASFLGLIGDTAIRMATSDSRIADPITGSAAPVISGTTKNLWNFTVDMKNNPKFKHVWTLLEREFSGMKGLVQAAGDVDFKAVNDFLFAKPQSRKPSLNLRTR